MATVVFDFDSTLIPVESLEEVLGRTVSDPGLLARIAEITRQGMEGELDFRSSLRARLDLAAPTRDVVRAVACDLADRLSAGASECVAALTDAGHTVRIVSGGFRDVILPTAARLGIGSARVHAVAVRWTAGGTFDGLVDDGFADSKVEGVGRLGADWTTPVWVVGDGATDRALAISGLADGFIAYTQHVRRAFLDEADVPEAGSMADVRRILFDLL